MANLQVTSSTQITQVQQTTVIQTPAQPKPQPAPVKPAPAPQPLFDEDSFKPSQPTSPVGLAKKLAGGVLIGASGLALAESAIKTLGHSGYTFKAVGPSMTGVGLGAALGVGIGLQNIDTGDKTTNNIKNMVSGALIGGAGLGIAEAVVKTIGHSGYSFNAAGPSALGIGIGVALGVGVAIMNMEE